MNRKFAAILKELTTVAFQFDEKAAGQKRKCLLDMAGQGLPVSINLLHYFELLLFIGAHPDDRKIRVLVESEFSRIAALLKYPANGRKNSFVNSGMPFTRCNSSFSHDCVAWLLNYSSCKITSHSYRQPDFNLNEVLKFTLPDLEKSETTIGLDNAGLLDSLFVKRKDHLSFILNELGKLDQTPFMKDHFYDGLGIYTDLLLKDKSFSRSYNRMGAGKIYFQKEQLKYFDHSQLIRMPLPPSTALSVTERKKIILVIKKSLALTDRETDPVTYMDPKSFRLYAMERGVAVAVYGMVPERQLPLESYVGYTLFKNGFPVAYGGGWMYGRYANFGINIFEPFRGGESGYLLCQLLRVFSQLFKVNYFEIEPYQFGLDNEEGIDSGAFWFYFRYGFRPLDKKLLKLAFEEHKKIINRSGYKSGKPTLLKFTNSPMVLKSGGKIPDKAEDVAQQVKRMMMKIYDNNRVVAVNDCIRKFQDKTGFTAGLDLHGRKVLEDVALWAEAMEINDRSRLELLVKMIKVKPLDLYAYQDLLLRFFN